MLYTPPLATAMETSHNAAKFVVSWASVSAAQQLPVVSVHMILYTHTTARVDAADDMSQPMAPGNIKIRSLRICFLIY